MWKRIAFAVVWVLPSCGGSDAAMMDAATPPDAAPTNVMVRATRDGHGVANVPILIHDADGVLLLETETGFTGDVTIDPFGPGEMITAIDGTRLVTYVDVLPGTIATFSLWSSTPETTRQVSIATLFPAATSYEARTGCFDSVTWDGATPPMTPIDLTLGDCARGSYDLVAIARDAEGTALAYATLLGVEPTSTPLTFGAWKTDWRTVTFSLTGLIRKTSVTIRAEQRRGDQYFQWGSGQPAYVFQDTFDASLQLPSDLGSSGDVSIDIVGPGDIGGYEVRGYAVLPDVVNLDASELLPGGAVTSNDSDDPTRAGLTWMNPAVAFDETLVYFSYRASDSRRINWIMHLRATATAARLPVLPAGQVSLEAVVYDPRLTFVLHGDLDFIDGFDESRAWTGDYPADFRARWSRAASFLTP